MFIYAVDEYGNKTNEINTLIYVKIEPVEDDRNTTDEGSISPELERNSAQFQMKGNLDV